MSIKKTIGGDNIGGGKKTQVEMHGYERANHDLSMINRLSLAPGELIPIYGNVAQTGDDWEFNINAAVRTLPTQMALFGTFQLQIHFFVCPIRLYNAALHNNGINLGNNMNQVVYPSIQVPVTTPPNMKGGTQNLTAWEWQKQNMHTSALLNYMGITNPGSCKTNSVRYGQNITYRYFNAAPIIAYWDIFKNYYSNKQEDTAYYIGAEIESSGGTTVYSEFTSKGVQLQTYKSETGTLLENVTGVLSRNKRTAIFDSNGVSIWIDTDGKTSLTAGITERTHTANNYDALKLTFMGDRWKKPSSIQMSMGVVARSVSEISLGQYRGLLDPQMIKESISSYIASMTDATATVDDFITITETSDRINVRVAFLHNTNQWTTPGINTINGMSIIPFPLANLDKARGYILKNFFEGEQVEITNDQTKTGYGYINYKPYSDLSAVAEIQAIDEDNNSAQYREIKPLNQLPQNGIALRRHLNDIFHSWLDSETVRRIESNTSAAVQNGQMSIATLILAEKMYKQKNRIEMSGGTYEDWKEAVYGIKQDHMSEMPMFIGGYSAEIVFDEVVSTSESTNSDGSINPLGTMGGRGTLNGKNGGRFDMKFTEDCYIIGIASIVPRVDYSQGNKWFYALQNNDQLHKPELDAIGFQNLVGDWMCGADTQVPLTSDPSYNSNKWGIMQVYAKQPAWINYMTAVNEAHGDFADPDKAMFMTLNRQYETENNADGSVAQIKDFTAYIDPRKYNYAFADTTIEAQNFWLQVGVNVEPRRKVSAKVMPNL